jgi:Cu+-exporting ATPase
VLQNIQDFLQEFLEVKNMIHIAEFILSTPVLFYSGLVFYKGAYFGLKNRMLNMDFLVLVQH